MNINISFKPDGTAHCLWTEVLPLHEFGRLEIHRASNIEFNNPLTIGKYSTGKAKFGSSRSPFHLSGLGATEPAA